MSQRISYYSTNRNLAGIPGLVPWKKSVSFREALLHGQAPDEGLFMPDRIPVISMQSIMALQGTPYTKAAMLVATAFLADEIHSDVLEKIITESYNFPVPIERVVARKFIMRLDQGPTASFKDFAARMMARLMSYFRDSGKRLNVLVACGNQDVQPL